MRLSEEIAKALGGEDPARIAYTVSGGGAYLRNVRRITEFSAKRIALLGKLGGVVIEGRELTLAKYAAGDVVIGGTVQSVSVTG